MYECKYTYKRKLGGDTHTMEIELNRDEIREIWFYYDQYLLEERVWLKLKDDFGIDDFKKFEQLVCDIANAYNKNRDFGCDEEFSMDEAFSDYHEEIEKLT